MMDINKYKNGTDLFYKKIHSHMKRVKQDVDEKDKGEKKAVGNWFYGDKVEERDGDWKQSWMGYQIGERIQMMSLQKFKQYRWSER